MLSTPAGSLINPDHSYRRCDQSPLLQEAWPVPCTFAGSLPSPSLLLQEVWSVSPAPVGRLPSPSCFCRKTDQSLLLLQEIWSISPAPEDIFTHLPSSFRGFYQFPAPVKVWQSCRTFTQSCLLLPLLLFVAIFYDELSWSKWEKTWILKPPWPEWRNYVPMLNPTQEMQIFLKWWKWCFVECCTQFSWPSAVCVFPQSKLELVVGCAAASMDLQLFSSSDKFLQNLDDNEALLGSYPVDDNCRIHVSQGQCCMQSERDSFRDFKRS